MRKNNKGFTLIELLAIIVILAIIAVITVPIILNVIDNAKKGAAKDSAYGLISAAEYYYANNVLNGENGYLFDGSTNILPYINVSGEQPDKGKIYMNDKGEIALAVVYGDYCITKYFNTDLYQSNDVDNCGVNNDFKIPSSYVAFGGEYNDEFMEVLKTSDGGFVAVGQSNSENYNGLKSHGTNINKDAIIVKYDSNGNIMWSKNFGGSNAELFYNVIEEENCYTVSGTSYSIDGDLKDIAQGESIFIVKFDKDKGNVIDKKALFTNLKSGNSYDIKNLIKDGSNYYAYITGRNINSAMDICYIVKYDQNFNEVWKNHYNDRYISTINTMIKTSNNSLVFVVDGYKKQGEITDIFIEGTDRLAVLFEISMEDGSILGKTSIGGNLGTVIRDVVEVNDGYIVVGSSSSTSNHFENKNNGKNDGFIAKIGKIPDENGILPIVWLKTIGGTNNDHLNGVVFNGNNISVIGYTYSSDGVYSDINNINNVAVALIHKFDLEGNLIKKNTIGGSNYDVINDIIINEDNYLIAGTSFSTDGDMQAFNYGNADAFLMSIDKELNPISSFEIKPVLVNNLPELVKNYGTEIPLSENKDNLKLYTTTNPSKDLGNLCGSVGLDPNSNYNYIQCLEPLNSVDKKTIFESSSNSLTQENIINVNSISTDWMRLGFRFSNEGVEFNISNLLIKFEGTDFVTIKDAVANGYIEPLVLSGYNSAYNYYFENSFNLIMNGDTGLGKYSSVDILIKPRTKLVEQVSFNLSKNISTSGGKFIILQYNNYDISLSPAQ